MRILGIDVGIASTGWAVVEISEKEDGGRIVAAGSRTFDSPEESSSSGPKLKNAERRRYRGLRRTVRRRAQRMAKIRDLFHQAGLIESKDRTALEGRGNDPWLLRAEGLDRCLALREFALALGHIAIHRGFRSNRKEDRADNASSGKSDMLPAIHANQERLAQWRTVGEMMARDPLFLDRRRNRAGDFTRSLMRSDQEAEVRMLFQKQRKFGNPAASEELMTAFMEIAFSQRPLASSEDKVGDCIFEPAEKRTARFAPSFERFRFLSRLVNLRLQSGREERRLTPGELALLVQGFGKPAKITFANIRKRLNLDEHIRFAGVSTDDEKKHDVVARTRSAAEGTAAFIKALDKIGPVEANALLSEGGKLDRVAEVITFNEDLTEIEAGLVKTGLSAEARAAILQALEEGIFNDFKGAAHISARAARNILPGLAEGLDYAHACEAVGYDHSARPAVAIDSIGSPVARKALSEALKQVKAVTQAFGPFDRIHVEMARDVGKSVEERGDIERGIKKRTAAKEKLRQELQNLVPELGRPSSEDLLRYELWKEQNQQCLYTGKGILLQSIFAAENIVQVDHVLPWSRFGDDSFINKSLCYTSANAEKADFAPYEWFMRTKPDDWERFSLQVEACKEIRGRKKRNYLIRNASEVEQKFCNRNLNDTRYATRVLLGELKRLYFPLKPHHVAARPGELTAKFRQAWGIESLKKDVITGERSSDDRHHALDAIIVALITDRMLQRATEASQKAEKTGTKFELRRFAPPWNGFREEVIALYETIIVSRAEVHRARGQAHEAGIKQIRHIDGEEKLFERKAIEKLTLKDLDMIPVPEPYGKVTDPRKLRDQLVESLRSWIEAGKPMAPDKLPRSPKGDIIRKVRVQTQDKAGVMVRGGTAGREGMIRVDVFAKPTKPGKREFYLVPIYRHEVATLAEPPNRAVQQGDSKQAWPVMDSSFTFLWSIYPKSLVETVDKRRGTIRGYYRRLDTSDGKIEISNISDNKILPERIGTRSFRYGVRLSRIGCWHRHAPLRKAFRFGVNRSQLAPCREGLACQCVRVVKQLLLLRHHPRGHIRMCCLARRIAHDCLPHWVSKAKMSEIRQRVAPALKRTGFGKSGRSRVQRHIVGTLSIRRCATCCTVRNCGSIICVRALADMSRVLPAVGGDTDCPCPDKLGTAICSGGLVAESVCKSELCAAFEAGLSSTYTRTDLRPRRRFGILPVSGVGSPSNEYWFLSQKRRMDVSSPSRGLETCTPAHVVWWMPESLRIQRY